MFGNIRVLISSFHRELIAYFVRPIWIFEVSFTPIVFVIISFTIFHYYSTEVAYVSYLIIGSAALGLWGSTLFGAGNSITRERFIGTLEYIIGTPSSLQIVVIGKILGSSLMGFVSTIFIFLFVVILANEPISIVSFPAFFTALICTFLSFVSMGVLLGSFFVLTRSATAYYNALSRSIYVLCGAMFPIAILPSWVRPISYILAPTWGIKALKMAAFDSLFSSWCFIKTLLWLLILSVVYLLFSTQIFKKIEDKIREEAKLVEL